MFKAFFKKNKYDYVFISSDSHFNEELVISQYVKTVCIQFTSNATDVNEIMLYFRYSRGRAIKKSKIFEYLTQASKFRCFGNLYGPHGGSYTNHLVMRWLKILPNGERMGMGNASYIFVMGQKFMDIFYEFGVPKNKIQNIGCIPYMNILDCKPTPPKKGAKQIITVFLQHFNEKPSYLYGSYTYYDALTIILNQIKKLLSDNIIIYFKYHPKEVDTPFLNEFFKSFNVDYKVFKQGKINNDELILMSSLNVMMNSTVGIDCMLLKAPLLSFGFGINYPIMHKAICQDVFVDTPDESCEYLKKILLDTKYRNELLNKASLDVQKFITLNKEAPTHLINCLKEG